MKTATRYLIRTVACSAFAAVSLLITSAIAVGASVGDVKVLGFQNIGLGAEARADTAVREQRASELSISANRSAIEASPMNAAAWLRMAYIQSAHSGSLDAGSIDAIDRSYSVAPFGPDVTAWRLQFLYGHWSQLPPDLRKEVMAEHVTYGRPIAITDERIPDRAGKLAAVLMNGSIKARRSAALEKREKLPPA